MTKVHADRLKIRAPISDSDEKIQSVADHGGTDDDALHNELEFPVLSPARASEVSDLSLRKVPRHKGVVGKRRIDGVPGML